VNEVAVTSGEARWAEGTILRLDQVGADDAGQVGPKAANLGELKRCGFAVPDGFVVLGVPGPGLQAALEEIGGGPVAVRSSGTAEDLADASFAGQYETILNVRGQKAVREAIRDCRESATNSRAQAYREQRVVTASSAMAVLVQQMVQPQAAGVAFTANPVTGDRDEIVISAVQGLGERLVSGEAKADQWVVRDGRPGHRSSVEEVITPDQALAIAELAQRAADHFGRPQDIEWALADGQLYLLQSRPMTALPPGIKWVPPGSGYWMRNLRLGEWLPEPVTPLFEDWLLKLLNTGFARGNTIDVGLGAGLRQATVNGWYYSTPQPDLAIGRVLKAVITRPRRIVRFATSLLKQSTEPDLAERRYFRSVVQRWRDEALPRYRTLVEGRAAELESAGTKDLYAIVDEVGEAAGEQLWCLAIGGGSAWKVEVALARFVRQHVAPRVKLDVPTLLTGLPRSTDHQAGHLVQSADWFRPTLGETGSPAPLQDAADRRRRLEERREVAETECRNVLTDQPALLIRFELLLKLAQTYAQLREEQAFLLTLGWPLMRRSVLRLGAGAVDRGAIERAEDAFFLTRSELEEAAIVDGARDRRTQVRARRSEWERNRRLSPPLALGKPPKLLQRMLATLELLRSDAVARQGSLHGEPASPGRASGRVRLIHGPEDFASFLEGEVLVAQATAPAWTPLFARAAAVVTDGGSLAAHASLVAREYGIPAVVATGDATARLINGQRVTVDGSGGFIEIEV
jgi:phosphohistidine swiveling domain-containing protein